MTHVPRDAGFGDLVMCKGRLGPRGGLRDRLALWLARYVATAIMRDADVRKEFAISLGLEFDKAERKTRDLGFDKPATLYGNEP